MINKCLILCAGEGRRFKEVGYQDPKPLVKIFNKPMIQWVYETLPECKEYIFAFLKEHIEKYHLEEFIQKMTNGKGRIVSINKVTKGAAETALMCLDRSPEKWGDNILENLLIVNSDQYIEYDKVNFNTLRKCLLVDGIIFTFPAKDKKWSFAKYDEKNGLITEVAEKNPISDMASCGLYYFKRISDFIWATEQMMKKNIRTNGEFYLCPVYNELIQIPYNKKIVPFNVNRMIPTGTPEDLEEAKRKLYLI